MATLHPMSTNISPIAPDITMGALLESYPGAQRAMFAKYHIGGCKSCGFRPDETLAEVCERNDNIAVDDAIAHIQEAHTRDLASQIIPTDLKAQLDAPDLPSPQLLDLRTREEHENGSITGTELFTQDKLQEIMGSWEKDREIVIYDHLGTSTCMDAAAYLQGHGFTNVKTLRGGIDAYAQEADNSINRYRIEIA